MITIKCIDEKDHISARIEIYDENNTLLDTINVDESKGKLFFLRSNLLKSKTFDSKTKKVSVVIE